MNSMQANQWLTISQCFLICIMFLEFHKWFSWRKCLKILLSFNEDENFTIELPMKIGNFGCPKFLFINCAYQCNKQAFTQFIFENFCIDHFDCLKWHAECNFMLWLAFVTLCLAVFNCENSISKQHWKFPNAKNRTMQ